MSVNFFLVVRTFNMRVRNIKVLVAQLYPVPSPGDLPDPGIKPGSPTLQAGSLPSEPPGKPLNNFLSVQ